MTDIELGEGLHTIGPGAFQFCISLKKIVIPSTVTKIGADAFNGCTQVMEVKFCEGRLQTIVVSAFADCTSLERIEVPSMVTEIGICTFDGCTSLKIADCAFRGCTQLVEVMLGEGLKNIGEGAFQRCISLHQINFPTTVTIIENQAFDGDGCLQLVQSRLSEGLEKIGVNHDIV